MIDHGKHSVLGVQIDAVDYDAAVERVIAAARERRPYAVSALAVHGVMTGYLDRAHRYRLNRFDLLTPDGQPVRWALNWLYGTKLPDRVTGPHLMPMVLDRAAAEGLPIFLFGSSDKMLASLSQCLQERHPGLQIAGTEASRFRKATPEEVEETAERIRASGAAITFVGLGCPRQEVWTYEMRDRLSMPLLAVGAAYAFHAGELQHAPMWLQDRGLEWFYRLVQEPRRLWRRYVLLNPLYLSLVALQFSRARSFDSSSDPPPSEAVRYG